MAGTEKVSISIGRDELRGAKRLASRLRLSLSMVITPLAHTSVVLPRDSRAGP